MGKKSAPKAPPAPDYAGLAQQQGQANLDAMRTNAEVTNTNQVTPYGNQMFTKDPNSDQWTSTISLSPEQKALYDNMVSGQLDLGSTANGMLGRVGDAVSQPFDTSGLPDRVGSLNTPQYSMYGNAQALPNSNLSLQDFSGTANLQGYSADPNAPVSSLDFSSAGKASTMEDFQNQAKEVQDSIYRQQTAQLDPQYQQEENALRTRLLNSGVTEGSEAYNNAMNSFGRQRTAAYGDARDRAIQGAVSTQSTMNQNALAARAQMLSQILNGGQFANSAAQQTFQNRNALTGLNNDNAMSLYQQQMANTGMNNQNAIDRAQFANTTAQQNFQNQNNVTGMNNSLYGQQFNDALTAGNFQNQARGSAMDEQAYLRAQPLNEYNSLMTGAQVTNPSFRQTGQVAPVSAAPVFAAGQAQAQNAMDLYNAQMASRNSAISGLTGLLGTGMHLIPGFGG